jgi:CBS domain containing-hemolysin-like protein
MTLQAWLLVLSLLTAAFAATAETALSSTSRSVHVRTLAESGDRRARQVARLHQRPNEYLSTILMLNTVAIIVASQAAVSVASSMPETLVTLVLAAVALIACEIAPKSFALRYNEQIALQIGRPVALLTTVLRPVVAGLTWVGTLPLRLIDRDGKVRGPFVTEQDLKMLVNVGEQEGVVEEEEREMIHGVLELTDKVAREVMVPRVDVVALDADDTIDDVVRVVGESGHSRIPVYEESIDNIIGVIYAKDVLLRARDPKPPSLRELARAAYFTPETKRAGELLHDMQVRNVHIAIVVDEYGGTAGIITIEDLIEEIVGEIRDEYDSHEEEEIQFLGDNEVLVTARLGLDDAKELLHLDIDPEEMEVDSIGGLVYERLGEIPKPGATVQVGDMTLTVEAVERQSIRTVRITSPRPFTGERGPHDGTTPPIDPQAAADR